MVPDFDAALLEAAHDDYGLAATVLTGSTWRTRRRRGGSCPVGTVKINNVFGGAPGGAAQPRRGSGAGFGYGPELLDEMTTTKVVHLAVPAAVERGPPASGTGGDGRIVGDPALEETCPSAAPPSPRSPRCS